MAPKKSVKRIKPKTSTQKKSSRPNTVDEYFDRLSEPALTALHKMRSAIRSVLPKDATETISYNIPAFKLRKMIVWYAAFSHHTSLFPTNSVLEQFKDDLRGFVTSKGTIQFSLEKPLPLPLIKKLVKARLQQVIAGRK
jgi:uncharacterized protein YdhG (YjbR/CyaY superfamily)